MTGPGGQPDANARIAAAMTATAAPWPRATRIDTGGRPEDPLRQVMETVRPKLNGLLRARRSRIPAN